VGGKAQPQPLREPEEEGEKESSCPPDFLRLRLLRGVTPKLGCHTRRGGPPLVGGHPRDYDAAGRPKPASSLYQRPSMKQTFCQSAHAVWGMGGRN
jgi:hypothetical protein